MVIREGMAWGLMMTSGQIPSHVNGMSCRETHNQEMIKKTVYTLSYRHELLFFWRLQKFSSYLRIFHWTQDNCYVSRQVSAKLTVDTSGDYWELNLWCAAPGFNLHKFSHIRQHQHHTEVLTWLCSTQLTSCLYVIPHVPFWPCRLANLSPIWGTLTERTLILQNLYPSWFTDNITWGQKQASKFKVHN